MHIQTAAVQTLRDHEHGAVVPPVHLASTFELDAATEDAAYAYQRGSNPTRAQLEQVLATLDGAEHGFAFATGMAATAAVFSTLQVGDQVLLPASVYGGTFRFVDKVFPSRGLTGRFVDDLGALTDADFTPATKMVFVETPANPTLRITDLRRLVELAHRHGALVAVDNTFMTPVLQRPLELGADVVVQSATKYLAGHSDLLAGTVTTNDPALAEAYALAQKAQGGVLSPSDSFRLIQAIKTLPLRLDRQQANAEQIVAHLREHDDVTTVFYPGSHSEDEARIHASQATGGGAVLSFELAKGLDRVRFIQALRYPVYAVSLGGVESLICRPATMTHEAMTPQARAAAGISDELLRLSVGIENIDDLIEDLDQALAAAR
ncbi:PLP-dependent aspartate aminotransferase family protein [Brachybacterium muris]|uniref:Homocysteine desulfhydrase n=1 Tax=Brachybacterium muris UCD-AY4 TaxID=1249481 RepID=A0A022KX65_9MICO|nr:PLP-dependent aspartate aminotransferase family protein [Brachybacterium muris]EYT50789.1 cystathionine gamma-synthase [Brachybacterium muris UCD-AY4]MCT1429587.1 PLP-dependent aspartate aminotransferase family protein [Brachybacterium muris]MCT2261205.1 PLP-dependent aspartate aminotransferase family protein [Brachybacterium muris]